MTQTSHHRKISINHQTTISKLHNNSKLNSNPFTILIHVLNFNTEIKIKHSNQSQLTINQDTKSSVDILIMHRVNYCCENTFISITYY